MGYVVILLFCVFSSLFAARAVENKNLRSNSDIKLDTHTTSKTNKNIRIRAKRLIPEKGPTPQNVLQMVQDKKGYLWFGTPHGLLKYDGYTITKYLHDPDNPNSISDNFINSMIVSRSGDLWIGTQNGLNRYDSENNNFTSYYPGSKNSKSLDNLIHLIFEDNNGLFWIGTQGGIYQFFPKGGVFNRSLFRGRAIAEGKTGILWFGGDEGLSKYERKNKKYHHYLPEPDTSELNNNHVWTLFVDKKDVLWVGTRSGLLRLEKDDFGNEKFIRATPKNNRLYNYPTNIVQSIYEDNKGIMWFPSGTGLYRYDRKSDKKPKKIELEFDSAQANESILWESVLWTVLEDNAGNFWIATNKGVYKADKKYPHIASYDPEAENKNSLSNSRVTDIVEDRDGILWIGTNDGLNRFDRRRNEWKHFFSEPGNSNSLSFNYITCLGIDSSDYIWVGTYNGGLNRFDPQKNEWKQYGARNDPDGEIYYWIHSINVSRDNTLWVGTWHGVLNKYDRQKDTFVQYKYNPKDTNSISKAAAIQVIFEDSFGILWLGTHAGILNSFDPVRNEFKYYQNESGNSKSLSNNSIDVLYEDSNKMLWIGTRNGLNRLDLNELNEGNNKPEFDRFLKGTWVSGILEDDEGHIWINSGLNDLKFSKLNPKTGLFIDYSYLFESPPQLFYKSKTSGEFFAGGKGLKIFHPFKIEKDQFNANVVFADFQIFNKSVSVAGNMLKRDIRSETEYVLEKTLDATKKIVLSHKERVFAFEFAALHYSDPAKNQYAYKLEGFDKEWNYIGTRRYVSFNNIPAGEYIFRVKASNNEGVWNEKGTSVKIIITPPWWKTWWAYSLYILTLIGLFFSIRSYELNRQRLKHNLELEHLEAEKLKEVDNLKSRFFASISHEFRTPLTLIKGPVERLLKQIWNKDQKTDLKRIYDNAKRMNKLVEMYLDLSRLESGNLSLQKEECDIVPLTKSIAASFESMAEAAQIKLDSDAYVASAICSVDVQKFEMILINLLSNAIKFTREGGSINLLIASHHDNEIAIDISDSGIGIAPEQLNRIFEMYYQVENDINKKVSGTGIGLAMARELIQMHDGKIEVESSPGQGTKFKIRLPAIRTDKVPFDQPVNSGQKSVKPGKAESQKADTKIRSDKELILIVEDNHQMCEYIKSHLENDYRTKLANNGKNGLAAALKINPALIISDVMMPEMDGYQLCRELKTNELTSHIPVILLTAKAEKKDKFAGLQIGADDYLVKPFDSQELQLRVKNLIEQRRRLREKFMKTITVNPTEIAVSSADEVFLQKVIHIVEENMENSAFDTASFAKASALSRGHLNTKLKALTGLASHEFIRQIRLKRAAQLLKKKAGNISEIAYQVGFNSPSHFSKAFKGTFGTLPSEYEAGA